MSTDLNIFISSAIADRAIARQFKDQLANKNLFVRDGLELTPAEFDSTDFSTCILIVLISHHALHDESLQADIAFALNNKMKVVPIRLEVCLMPDLIKNLLPFNYIDFFSTQYDQFLKLTGLYHRFNLQAAAPPPQVYPSFPPAMAPAPKTANKSFLKNLLETINPFKKSGNKSVFDGYDKMTGSSAGSTGSSPSKRSSPPPSSRQAGSGGGDENPASFEPYEKIDTRPPSDNSGGMYSIPIGGQEIRISDLFPEQEVPLQQQEPIAPDSPGKGKVLYDIPDTMTVHVPHKCVVRVGKNEAIVLDDDNFSPSVQIETIPISKVMEVDMVDISDPPRFNIKKISSVEQLVDEDSYSEWIFMVTPLTGGVYPLLLKVSVIKVIDGKERRKELVFTRSINISAATPVTNDTTTIVSLLSQAAPLNTKEPGLKELLKEKDIKELDPPAVFISYAHNDKTYFDIFIQYLQTHSGWTIWTDRNIEIGSGWYQSIQSSIKDSDIAVLLISANFISSGFIKEHEYEQFSKLQATKPGFKFLPLLLRDVDFTRWQDLAAMQLFVAYGDEYGVPEKRGVMIPFAKLCRFDNNSQLIPNDNIDTYFKNLVKKAEKDWLISRR